MGRFTKFNQSVDKFGDGLVNWFKAKTGQELSNAQREANAFTASEAQKARDFNLQMYKDYQSPQAMMQQYQDANLNPALMYEGYSPSSVSSSAAASSVAPTSESNIVTDAVQSMLGFMTAKQQIDLQRAQIKSINADTEGKQIDNANKQRMYDIEYNLKDINIKEAQQDIEKSKAEVNKITQDIKESVSRIDVNNKQIEIGDSTIELQGTQAELNRTKQIVEKLNADTIAAMLPYVEKVQQANLALTEAQTSKAWNEAERALHDAELSMYKAMGEYELINAGYYSTAALNEKRRGAVMVADAVVGNTCKVVDTVAGIFFPTKGIGKMLGKTTQTSGPKGTTRTETTYQYE